MQTEFIQNLIEKRASVIVYTINGFQLRGCIVDLGEDYILVKCNGKTSMIFTHAVSTISPA